MLILVGFVQIFFPFSEGFQLAIAFAGVLIFSGYIIFGECTKKVPMRSTKNTNSTHFTRYIHDIQQILTGRLYFGICKLVYGFHQLVSSHLADSLCYAKRLMIPPICMTRIFCIRNFCFVWNIPLMIINAIVQRYKETNGIIGFFYWGVYQRSEAWWWGKSVTFFGFWFCTVGVLKNSV